MPKGGRAGPPLDAVLDQGVRARRRSSIVVARLQGDVRRASLSALSRLPDRPNLPPSRAALRALSYAPRGACAALSAPAEPCVRLRQDKRDPVGLEDVACSSRYRRDRRRGLNLTSRFRPITTQPGTRVTNQAWVDNSSLKNAQGLPAREISRSRDSNPTTKQPLRSSLLLRSTNGYHVHRHRQTPGPITSARGRDPNQ